MEKECGAPCAAASDFMAKHLKEKTLSAEAKAGTDEGKKLWKLYGGAGV